MRIRSPLILLLLFAGSSVSGLDRWIPAAGSIGVFRTDTRVFNPSFDKDIEVSAWFLPVEVNTNANVIAGAPVTFTVTKRQMKVYDDVVLSLFNTGGVGAILLRSADDFVATSRIYAGLATGTLGQFAVALPPEAGLTKGVVIQLKSNATFRSNVGMVNPGSVANEVLWKLYDRNNALVATQTKTYQPYFVTNPTNVRDLFSVPPATDLTDGWVSFTAQAPIIAYGSVIDGGSTDPTLVPAQADSGVEPDVPPAKTVTIVASDFEFAVTKPTLNAGDQVNFILSRSEGSHGFRLGTPNGQILINTILPNTPTTFTVTLPEEGTYFFVCSNSGCGEGHFSMTGELVVGKASPDGPIY